ncbi:hypothetical protein [Nannocystis punicea]|uniref:Uncharacterized protein n=1 Tax=Nannocystis punicea TaxID=2995304 RepID=A0ABY7H138_9BACT|nr:hypothetical protein [Nannocystis poenicansa]WAS92917.1 hypothetical protein O0S08_42650 [Nannocystis poenicansa]
MGTDAVEESMQAEHRRDTRPMAHVAGRIIALALLAIAYSLPISLQ